MASASEHVNSIKQKLLGMLPELQSALPASLGELTDDVNMRLTSLLGTHDNWRLDLLDSSFHVKWQLAHNGELFSQRSHFELQQILAVHGHAPHAYYCRDGLFVTAWHAIPAVAVDPETIAERQATIHALDIKTRDASLKCHYPEHLALLDESTALPTAALADRVFAHNDLHHSHILADVCVDWEYAGIAERAYDLANTVVINRYSLEQCEAFIAAYLRAMPNLTYDLHQAIMQFVPLVRTINDAWTNAARYKK
jgi:hypothetical protein